jgi:hypothetical protein
MTIEEKLKEAVNEIDLARLAVQKGLTEVADQRLYDATIIIYKAMYLIVAKDTHLSDSILMRAIEALDEYARDVDVYEYGLPMNLEVDKQEMVKRLKIVLSQCLTTS